MLINRDFTLLSIGGLVSLLGDYIYETTLALWIGTQLLAASPTRRLL